MSTFSPAASADDANEVVSSGAVNITADGTGSPSPAKLDGTNHGGWRFPSIVLAQGASIGSAILKFPQLSNYSGFGTLNQMTLYGEASDNSSQFSTATSNISARSRTSANVVGSAMAATDTQWQTTGIDVTAIIQEVVNRPGWASGNALSLLIIASGTSGQFIQPYMWDYFTGTFKATLAITSGSVGTAALVAGSNFTAAGLGLHIASSSLQAGSNLTASLGHIVNSGSILLTDDSFAYATIIKVLVGAASAVAGSNLTASYPTVYLGQANIVAGSNLTVDGELTETNTSKLWEYKVFDHSSHTYITSWEDVLSDFQYSETINTAGNGIQIELGRTADSVAALLDNLVNETPENITTQSDEPLLVVTSTGTQFGPGASVDVNLDLEVWVYYGYDDLLVDETGGVIVDENNNTVGTNVGSPNGLRMFSGYISSFGARYGNSETTLVNAVPYGIELDNHVINYSGVTNVNYFSVDPSFILKDILGIYASESGMVGYTNSSIASTGTKVSYNYQLNSTLEGIQKVLELSPTDWFWYLNVGENSIYLQPLPTYPTHTFTLGKHIQDAEIIKTMENLVNLYYFLGGTETDNSTLYRRYSDPTSITTYRQGLGRQTDQRVTDPLSADIISNTQINRFKAPRYTGQITILDINYEIETIQLGQSVAFNNFNNFIDSLQLMVVGRQYTPDSVILTLDTLLPAPSKRLEDIKRTLAAQQQLNAPDSPS